MQTLEQLIAASPVFAGMAQEHLALIAGCAVNDHFPADAWLFREGEPADRFFLIRKGAVALQVQAPGRGALVIETLHAGEVAGWSWLFEPYRWQFDGRAASPTRVVSFDGSCLRGKCETDHELGYQLMRRFAASLLERLQATRLQLLDVYGHGRAD
ncbi:MAG TPA: cyclic nucleotide-binding domain-containing protein [Solirubrobacteraceae bacterium]|nr:cyclic nucleotide-binding domain-containing protein [Solirubrobacteraceae bacterium]